MRSVLLAGIRWSVCMPKSHRSLCESFSRTGTGLCIYHLFVWSNWNFLHISQWITLPTQSFLALYSFCVNLLHSLIIIIIIIIIIVIYSFRVFHISVSWWFFTRVLVTSSLLKSPGLFSVPWPSSIMLSFGWSPLVRQLTIPQGPLIILQLLCQKHQSQLVPQALSCSLVPWIL